MPGFEPTPETCPRPQKKMGQLIWPETHEAKMCAKHWDAAGRGKGYSGSAIAKNAKKGFSTNTKNVHSLATHGKIDATNRHSNIEHAAYDTGSLYRGYGGKKKTRKLKKGKKGTKKNRKGKKSKGRKSKK